MPETEPKLDESTRRSLKFSTIEGAFYNAMTGFTDYFINPFAIALGVGNSAIGLIRSLPPLLMAIGQPVGLGASRLFSSRKKFVMAAVAVQSLMLVFLLSIPYLFRQDAEIMLLIVFSLYSVMGPLANPVWTSWMADLVPEKIRGRYFGSRNMVGGGATIASIVLGGLILNLFGQDVFLAFAVLFALAGIFRMLSFASLAKIGEPAPKTHEYSLDLFGFIREIKYNDFGIFLLYYSLLIFSTAIAGFYFSVHMIRNLHFTYEQFAVIEAFFALAMLLSSKYWGKIIDQFGNKLALSVCGLLVPFVPFLWLTSKSPYLILLFEIFSGFAWGGLNLALFNYTIGYGSLKNKTAQYAANFNLAQGVSVFLGAIVGAYFVENGSLMNFTGIPLVFLLSGGFRLLAGLAFLPLIREFKDVQHYRGNALLNFAFLIPARRVGFFAHEAFVVTGKGAKGAMKRLKYKL